ncbi:MAG: DUF2268 domain-containing protein, partial [Pseudonocardia sp.]|nr:DUF2268 domain-containing protein [Pseudonocardia sp.]
MTITILDTYPAMHEILHAPQADRPHLLRAMLEPATGLYRYFPGEVDVVQMHFMGSGFPIDRDERRCRDGLAALRAADAWGRIERALGEAVELQRGAVPEVVVPDIAVLLVLADPGDAHLMGPNLGITANGSVSGYLYINVWPFPENLERLEATAVHELNHNLRYTTRPDFWDPATVTVGEQV